MMPIQLFALDPLARQALKYHPPLYFEEIIECDLVELQPKNTHRQILLLSQLNSNTLALLLHKLDRCNDPIIILPESFSNSKELLQIATKARILLSPTDSLISLHLAETLKQLQIFLYSKNGISDIQIDQEDVYSCMQPNTISRILEHSGQDALSAIKTLTNHLSNFKSVTSLLLLFHLDMHTPLLDISNALAYLEESLTSEPLIIFGTQISQINQIKITTLFTTSP